MIWELKRRKKYAQFVKPNTCYNIFSEIHFEKLKGMTEVKISEVCKRAALEQANLQYIEEHLSWVGLWEFNNNQIELRIDGNEQCPNDEFVELAEIVLPILQEIESASNAYLREFMGNDDDCFYKGEWRIQSLRIQPEKDSGRIFSNQFEVTLSVIEDDYGQWSVRFRYHTYPSRVLSPYFFSRRQW